MFLKVSAKASPQTLNNGVLVDLNDKVGGRTSALEEEVDQEDPDSPRYQYLKICGIPHRAVVSVTVE